MAHFKEIKIACVNIYGILKTLKTNKIYLSENMTSIFEMPGGEPPFRANVLFQYAQSGPGRISFSGSTVPSTTDLSSDTLRSKVKFISI